MKIKNIYKSNNVKNKNSFLLGLALLGLATVAKAQTAGTINTSFGINGIASTDISYANNYAKKELLQTDGKIIIIGYNGNVGGVITRYNANGTLDTTFNGTGRQFTDVYFANAALQSDGKILLTDYNKVYRYNSNGTLDTTFGANGVYTYSVPSGTSFSINNIAIQIDGKIVLSAYEDLYLNNVSNVNFAALRLNSNGTIDTTFNGIGKVTKDINKTDNVGAVAIQTDGKIILAGYTTTTTGNQFYTAVRFNSNGSIDNTFGSAGVVTGNNTLAGFLSGGIALQSDGKIVLAGNSASIGIKTVRLNTNGTLDTTFNGTGAVTTNLADDRTESVAIQADGKIVVTGSKYDATAHTSEYFVLRYNTNGTLDTTFNASGVVLASIDKTKPNTAADVKIQTDGKIVVCGTSYVGSYKDIAIIRINNNGTLDNTFNGTGKVTSGFLKSGTDVVEKIAVQNDGKILAAGYTSSNNISLARYNANGTLDTSFNTKGYVTTNLQHTYFDNFLNASAVLSQTDGKVLIVGNYYSSTSNNQEIFIRRYNASGTVDTTFGASGMASLGINAKWTFSNAAILQTDGKIMIVGNSYNNNTVNVFTLVRFNNNGTLDTTFNGTGFLNTTIGVNSEGNSILLQPDGKILVGGWITNGADRDLLLMRYNANGTLDSTFNGNGKVTKGIGTSNDEVLKIALQADGKIAVLSNYVNTSGNVILALLRYNSNGSLDTSFNSTGQLLTNYSGFSVKDSDMVLDTLNRIIISSAYGGGIVRYNTNGTLDTTFVNNEIFSSQFITRPLIITNNHLVVGGDYFSDSNGSSDFGLSSVNLYNIGLVGAFNGWGNTPDATMSSTDGINFSLTNYVLPATEVKFRENNAWNLNWGGNSFPAGGAMLNGNNIVVPAGTYDIKINITGDYNFTKKLGTADSDRRDAFSFAPNPAKEKIIFNEEIKTLEIFALDGKKLNLNYYNKEANVSALPKGIYIIKATSGKGDIMSKKLIKE